MHFPERALAAQGLLSPCDTGENLFGLLVSFGHFEPVEVTGG